MKRSITIGWDPREQAAYRVGESSLLRHLSASIDVEPLVLSSLQELGLYTRPTYRRNGRLIDTLSIRDDYDGSISTEHAIARFLVPQLAKSGWALFTDGDVLVRDDLNKVFDDLDASFALYCVKHQYAPREDVKMDGQVQTVYPRKNWSSVMIFNCDHPYNRRLAGLVNTLPGRDLHAFCWLPDDLIGSLDARWNHLVGHSHCADPAIVHFTQGTPDMPGYKHCEYADDWRAELARVHAAHPEALACRA